MEVADQIVVMNHGRIEQVGAPRELYEHPANEFVMSFVGPVNRLGDDLRPAARLRARSSSPNGHATEALVERVVHLGFEVRVELVRGDGEQLSAQITPRRGRPARARAGPDRLRAPEPRDRVEWDCHASESLVISPMPSGRFPAARSRSETDSFQPCRQILIRYCAPESPSGSPSRATTQITWPVVTGSPAAPPTGEGHEARRGERWISFSIFIASTMQITWPDVNLVALGDLHRKHGSLHRTHHGIAALAPWPAAPSSPLAAVDGPVRAKGRLGDGADLHLEAAVVHLHP